jgi:23S rRNA-/tRNA-specific pseudouridylate synthase
MTGSKADSADTGGLPSDLEQQSSSPLLEALRRPQPVHRLDQGTGGLLLVAKTRRALTNLTAQFCDRSIEKTYLAMVAGKLETTAEPINKRRKVINNSSDNLIDETDSDFTADALDSVILSGVIKSGASITSDIINSGSNSNSSDTAGPILKKGLITESLGGQEAVTEFEVNPGMQTLSSVYGAITTVTLMPHTGRTHQLRRFN